MKRKICFRADASSQIGYGHFIRTLALADMLKEDFDCVFYTAEPSSYQIGEIQKVCSLVPLSENSKFEDFLAILDGSEIVVLDNYFYTTDYQKKIKTKGCKLVCIDDMHDKYYVADAVINHGLVSPCEFDCEPYTRLCLGSDWTLLRKPFLNSIKRQKRKKQIVVCLGGTDPLHLTDRIVSYLYELGVLYKIIVILEDVTTLSVHNRDRVIIKHNLSAQQMAELFESSSIGILPSSSVRIEAVSRGLRVICGYFVDNQQKGYEKGLKRQDVVPIYNFYDLTSEKLAKALSAAESFTFNIPDYSNVPLNYKMLLSSL